VCPWVEGLSNPGEPCLLKCDGKEGFCPTLCGTGICCRKKQKSLVVGNPCDGKKGIFGMGHVCVAQSTGTTVDDNSCLEYAFADDYSPVVPCTQAEWNKLFDLMDEDFRGGKNGKVEDSDVCTSSEVSFPKHFRLL
jgi:hypothetical protein